MLLGFGLGTTDQTMPFQDSVNVVPVDVPTAMQKLELVQDTPSSWPELAIGAAAVAVGPGTARPKAVPPNTRRVIAVHDRAKVVRQR